MRTWWSSAATRLCKPVTQKIVLFAENDEVNRHKAIRNTPEAVNKTF